MAPCQFFRKEERLMFKLTLDNLTNVDYTHFLPSYDGKCNRIHSHTSYGVSVSVFGYKRDDQGWLVDFKEIKRLVKEVVEIIDHKIVVGENDNVYIGELGGGYLSIYYDSPQGKKHYIELPQEEVVVLPDRHSTIEDITEYLCEELLKRLPQNVTAVELVMAEGVSNKCSCFRFRKNNLGGSNNA